MFSASKGLICFASDWLFGGFYDLPSTHAPPPGISTTFYRLPALLATSEYNVYYILPALTATSGNYLYCIPPFCAPVRALPPSDLIPNQRNSRQHPR